MSHRQVVLAMTAGAAALVLVSATVAPQEPTLRIVAVVQAMGQVVAVLIHAQAANVPPIAIHDVEIAARFVLVVLVALECSRAAFGDKYDVTVGSVSWVEVAPFAVCELAQARAIYSDLENMNRLFLPAQMKAPGAIQPSLGRLLTASPCVTKNHAVALP